MITPNTPRFLRQGDQVVISAKITNLTDREMEGFIGLQLSDPYSGEATDDLFQNIERNKPFSVSNRSNTQVSWQFVVPEKASALQYKIVARSGDFSDGEQNALPMQQGDGGFPWFSGSTRVNRYITQHIIAGLAHLQHLHVVDKSYKTKAIISKGLKFLEREILNDYNLKALSANIIQKAPWLSL